MAVGNKTLLSFIDDAFEQVCCLAGEQAPDAQAHAGPTAEQYSEMLRNFFFLHGSGGYNSECLIPVNLAEEKLRWIVDDSISSAELRTAPAGDALDAARYLWVREGHTFADLLELANVPTADWDKAIDAAMREKGKP